MADTVADNTTNSDFTKNKPEKNDIYSIINNRIASNYNTIIRDSGFMGTTDFNNIESSDDTIWIRCDSAEIILNDSDSDSESDFEYDYNVKEQVANFSKIILDCCNQARKGKHVHLYYTIGNPYPDTYTSLILKCDKIWNSLECDDILTMDYNMDKNDRIIVLIYNQSSSL